MEGVLKGNDLVLFPRRISDLAHLAGEFDGSLVGLAAGIADEDFGGCLHAAGCDCFDDD